MSDGGRSWVRVPADTLFVPFLPLKFTAPFCRLNTFKKCQGVRWWWCGLLHVRFLISSPVTVLSSSLQQQRRRWFWFPFQRWRRNADVRQRRTAGQSCRFNIYDDAGNKFAAHGLGKLYLSVSPWHRITTFGRF